MIFAQPEESKTMNTRFVQLLTSLGCLNLLKAKLVFVCCQILARPVDNATSKFVLMYRILCRIEIFYFFQIIVERYEKEKHLPQLDKSKFLVPKEITMSQFTTIIR